MQQLADQDAAGAIHLADLNGPSEGPCNPVACKASESNAATVSQMVQEYYHLQDTVAQEKRQIKERLYEQQFRHRPNSLPPSKIDRENREANLRIIRRHVDGDDRHAHFYWAGSSCTPSDVLRLDTRIRELEFRMTNVLGQILDADVDSADEALQKAGFICSVLLFDDHIDSELFIHELASAIRVAKVDLGS